MNFSDADARSATRKKTIIGAVITALVSLLFFSLYWNRFLGLRSGSGAYAGGSSILAGLLPYRDYFTASTPLNILKSAAVLKIFGNAAIVLRAFDVIQRVGLGVIVYFWLVRLFRVRDAALAAIVTIIVSASDVADPISSYNHDAVFWAVASGFVGSFALDRLRSLPAFIGFSLGCGFLAGLSFATKQTVGLGATTGIPFIAAACIWQFAGVRRSAIFLAAFTGGWCLSAGALLLWLSYLGVLSSFINQAFVKGPAAKASHPSDFLVRFLFVVRVMRRPVILALAALALTVRSWTGPAIPQEQEPRSSRDLWWLALLSTAAAGLGAAASYAGFPSWWHGVSAGQPPIFFTLFSVAILLLYYSYLYLRRGLSWRQSQYFLFAMVSFATASMLSLSWPAFEAMVVPGLGLLIALTLRGMKDWRSYAVYCVCGALIFGETLARLNLPFSFLDLNEGPVRIAKYRSSLPELRGFLLPQSTVKFVDGAVRIIREHSTPADTIFIFPEMGLFYRLTNRRAPTETDSHNIDVVNDEFSRSEARKVLAAKPAVIIYYREPEQFLKDQDLIWRGGKRSGQWDIVSAVESLIKNYKVAGTFDMPESKRQIDVYVRK
ncbi:MAG: hypothetical protein M3Z09_01770 [Acidobacteriota bacterium]|nr:hypothetical protein [Acidobacteriota bacterium]